MIGSGLVGSEMCIRDRLMPIKAEMAFLSVNHGSKTILTRWKIASRKPVT